MASQNGISVPVTADTSDVDAALDQLVQRLQSLITVAAQAGQAANAAAKSGGKSQGDKDAAKQLAAAQQLNKAKEQLDLAELATEQQVISAAQKLGQISDSQALTARQNLATAKAAIEIDELTQQAATLQQGTAQYDAQQDKILAIREKYAAQMVQITTQGIQTEMKDLQSYFAPIESSFTKSITGMITGTTNFKKAITDLGQSVVSDAVQHAVQWATTWAEQELATLILHQQITTEKAAIDTAAAAVSNGQKTAATASDIVNDQLKLTVATTTQAQMTAVAGAGAASRAAIEDGAASQSLALSAETAIADIANKAAQAAAGAYSAIAAIPYVGPVLAPVAAAAALAAVIALGRGIASAEGGWDQVPSDQIAQLHKNEMVLPASIAGPLRSAIAGTGGGGGFGMAATASPSSALPSGSGGAAAGGAGGNSAVHVHYAPNVQAMDATGVDRVLRNHGSTFLRHFQNAQRNGSFKGSAFR